MKAKSTLYIPKSNVLFVHETQCCCYLFKCLVIYSIIITEPEAPLKVWDVVVFSKAAQTPEFDVIWVQLEVSQEPAASEMKSSQ